MPKTEMKYESRTAKRGVGLDEQSGGCPNRRATQCQIALGDWVRGCRHPDVLEEEREALTLPGLTLDAIHGRLSILLDEIFEWSGAEHAEGCIASTQWFSHQDELPKPLGI